VGIKDIFFTASLLTTMGSPIYKDFYPDYDAATVSKLRDSGAIILGKTETTQFAETDPAPTKNPWNLNHTPGGSSSGSAASVASGMCQTALGTQTGGSVIRPASYCGIVGLKPTYDLLSRSGVYPLSWSLDHVGIFTRTVEDASLVLDSLTGMNSSANLQSEEFTPKVGIAKQYFSDAAHPEVKKGFNEVVDKIASSGDFTDFKIPPSFSVVHSAHRIIMGTEAAAIHENNYLNRPSDYRINIRGMITSGLLVPAVAYLKAQRIKRLFIKELNTMMEDLDCLITPSTTTPALKGLSSTGSAAFNAPWSFAGFPSITIPSGVAEDNLPLGLQLIGKPYTEKKLIKIAATFEEVINWDLLPVDPIL
jgi:Asp-tRNA(Asn)/Glu-tRNA(Gln) amidotransferase A subunit family amidase